MAYANRQTFRPSSDPDPTPSEIYSYCSLRAQGYPFRFTWDQAAINLSADNRTYLTGFLRDVSSDLIGGLSSRFGPSLKPKLVKVKEIHFTTSPKKRSLDDFGTLGGYFFSFNPTTGVLTAAMSQPDGAISISEDSFLTQWIIKYVM